MPAVDFATFRRRFFHDDGLGLSLDLSRVRFPRGFEEQMLPRMNDALEEMKRLESGAVANVDEGRMVGHYWLRAPDMAPTMAITQEIRDTAVAVRVFCGRVHAGTVHPQRFTRFENMLVIGIGGSALGPQFVSAAAGSRNDRLKSFFLDNTDPDGFDRVFDAIGDRLDRTLTVVISKSGGTRETRNGMLEAKARYEAIGLTFGRHAVAVTGSGSELERFADAEGFLARFPMWDFVGGRTSMMSAVGFLPIGLQGISIDSLFTGARDMDVLTRRQSIDDNPAALLALAWFAATDGLGRRDMVILPYKDRLELFPRYLQQLVMESLGKRLDRTGKEVFQGLTVYGNKGSTDQHAYVQQLRDGLDNAFVTFIDVLLCRDPSRLCLEVEPGITAGDYLEGFLRGTREALWQAGRDSITITVDKVDTQTVGALIALYERAVGLYASLVNVNAYHQPGVEAGKKAADEVLALQRRVLTAIQASDRPLSLDEVAARCDQADPETVFHILRQLSANPGKKVRMERAPGASLFDARWKAE